MMYYPLYAILYLLSLLPTRLLYILSDLLCFLVYNVFAYRKKIVMSNITQAFPGKTREEILAITKKFYKNFIDSFIETIKLISASEEYIRKHIESRCGMLLKLCLEKERNASCYRVIISTGNIAMWVFPCIYHILFWAFTCHLKINLWTGYF